MRRGAARLRGWAIDHPHIGKKWNALSRLAALQSELHADKASVPAGVRDAQRPALGGGYGDGQIEILNAGQVFFACSALAECARRCLPDFLPGHGRKRHARFLGEKRRRQECENECETGRHFFTTQEDLTNHPTKGLTTEVTGVTEETQGAQAEAP